ncbi:MAG: hypothetical protein NDJ65_02070 [Paludibacteraceae bacterium]|jgi:hypothetical protein|nr:hypothetical protein [Paludibacteraceae bacterium]
MSRSRKKVCGGMICGMYGRSRKWGKRKCHKRFRAAIHHGKLVFRMREVMNTWDMGGDGKMVYTWDKNSDCYKKYTRK